MAGAAGPQRFPMRIALGIEYDGAAFSGWQTQSDGAACKTQLKARWRRLRARAQRSARAAPIAVSSLDQVIHFDRANRPLSAWVSVLTVSSGVDCRAVGALVGTGFTSLRRTRGGMTTGSERTGPLSARACTRGWVSVLDEAAMRQAARHLIGDHDFTSFRSRNAGGTPMRD